MMKHMVVMPVSLRAKVAKWSWGRNLTMLFMRWICMQHSIHFVICKQLLYSLTWVQAALTAKYCQKYKQ